MSRNLQNHERESELKHRLQRHQAPQSVVIALLGCREKMHNQQHASHASQPLHYSAQHGECNGAIETNEMWELVAQKIANR